VRDFGDFSAFAVRQSAAPARRRPVATFMRTTRDQKVPQTRRQECCFVENIETGRDAHLNSLSANAVGAEGRGEVVLKSPLRSLRDILSPRFAAGRGERPLQRRTMVSAEQQECPRYMKNLSNSRRPVSRWDEDFAHRYCPQEIVASIPRIGLQYVIKRSAPEALLDVLIVVLNE
jgi:hypothetical protein